MGSCVGMSGQRKRLTPEPALTAPTTSGPVARDLTPELRVALVILVFVLGSALGWLSGIAEGRSQLYHQVLAYRLDVDSVGRMCRP